MMIIGRVTRGLIGVSGRLFRWRGRIWGVRNRCFRVDEGRNARQGVCKSSAPQQHVTKNNDAPARRHPSITTTTATTTITTTTAAVALRRSHEAKRLSSHPATVAALMSSLLSPLESGVKSKTSLTRELQNQIWLSRLLDRTSRRWQRPKPRPKKIYHEDEKARSFSCAGPWVWSILGIPESLFRWARRPSSNGDQLDQATQLCGPSWNWRGKAGRLWRGREARSGAGMLLYIVECRHGEMVGCEIMRCETVRL